MDVVTEQVKKQSLESGRKPVYTAPCKENSCSILKKDSIAVITNKSLDIYSQGQGTLRVSIPWITISSISINGNEIKLKFTKKNVTIFSEIFVNQIFGAIVHTLQQVLTTFEAKCLSLDQYNVPKVKNSGYGAFIRFNEICAENKIEIAPVPLKKLELALMESRNEVRVAEFGDPSNIIPLFFSISSISPFSSAILPFIADYPIYNVLAQYAPSIARLKYIEIPGKADNKFEIFLKSMMNQTASQLRGISFTNTEFTPKHLKQLSDFIGQTKLSAVGFHNALTIDSYPSFYAEFFTSAMIGSLTVLNLSGSKGLDIQKLFPLLRNIYVLNLENCGLHVDRIFSQMALSGIRCIRAINVSNNLCEHFPSTSMSVSTSLISIVANNIRWCDCCLSNLLKLLFFRQTNLKISLANASASATEWNSVFQLFAATRYENIISLTWDGNPLNSNLFSYISRNTQLEYLSMSNCFSQTEPAAISTFSRVLESCPSLKFLIVRGGMQKTIGRLIGAITRIVVMKKNLIHVDIGDNKLGDNGLMQLKPLFTTKSSLKMVNFDGSAPQTYETISDVLELASRVQEQIHTSFPINDLTKLKESNVITQEMFDLQLHKFQRAPKIKSGTQSQLYQIPINSPFIDPFNIFVNETTQTFPKYLSEEEIRDMKEMPEKPFLKTKSQIEFTSNKVFSGTIGRPQKKNLLAKDIFGRPTTPPPMSASTTKAPPAQSLKANDDLSMRDDCVINSDDYVPAPKQLKKAQPTNKQIIVVPSQGSYSYYSDSGDAQPQVIAKKSTPPPQQVLRYSWDEQTETKPIRTRHRRQQEPVQKQPQQVQQIRQQQVQSRQQSQVIYSDYDYDSFSPPSPPPQPQPVVHHRSRKRNTYNEQQVQQQAPVVNQQQTRRSKRNPSLPKNRKLFIDPNDYSDDDTIQARNDVSYSEEEDQDVFLPSRRTHRRNSTQQSTKRRSNSVKSRKSIKEYDDYEEEETQRPRRHRTRVTDSSRTDEKSTRRRHHRTNEVSSRREEESRSRTQRRGRRGRREVDDYNEYDDYEEEEERRPRRSMRKETDKRRKNFDSYEYDDVQEERKPRRSLSAKRRNERKSRRDEDDEYYDDFIEEKRRERSRRTQRRDSIEEDERRSRRSRREESDRLSVKSRKSETDRRSVKSYKEGSFDEDRRSVKSRKDNDDRRSVKSSRNEREESDRRSVKSRRNDSDRRSVKSRKEDDKRSVKSRKESSDDFIFLDSELEEESYSAERKKDSLDDYDSYDRSDRKSSRSHKGESDRRSVKSRKGDEDRRSVKGGSRRRDEKQARRGRRKEQGSYSDEYEPPEPRQQRSRAQKVDARKLNAFKQFSDSGSDTFDYYDSDNDARSRKSQKRRY